MQVNPRTQSTQSTQSTQNIHKHILISADDLVADVIHYLSKDSKWSYLVKIINMCHTINPYKGDEYKMWDEQCGINFPLMYVSSIYLYIYAKERNIDTFLFATRDCSHWVKIFKALFPEEHVIYYNCSRHMFDIAKESNNKYFKEYTESCLKTSIENAIYVDIHGTGAHTLSYFSDQFGATPCFFMISSSYREYKEFPRISINAKDENKFINLIFDARGTPIEMLNYDIIGTMKDYKRSGAIRCEPEYNLEYLEPYHVCINYLITKVKPLNNEFIATCNVIDLLPLIRKIYRVIQDNPPAIAQYAIHPIKHSKVLKDSKKN